MHLSKIPQPQHFETEKKFPKQSLTIAENSQTLTVPQCCGSSMNTLHVTAIKRICSYKGRSIISNSKINNVYERPS